MTLKPGTVCYLVRIAGWRARYTGRVVSVAGPSTVGPDWLEVAAEWLTREFPEYGSHHVLRACLVPISDPDQPVTTNTRERLTA